MLSEKFILLLEALIRSQTCSDGSPKIVSSRGMCRSSAPARLRGYSKRMSGLPELARRLFVPLGALAIGTARLMSVALDVPTLEDSECINPLVHPPWARVGATSSGATKAKLPAQSLAPTPPVAIFHGTIALALAAPHWFQRQLPGRFSEYPVPTAK
jgi:hypothetical protein